MDSTLEKMIAIAAEAADEVMTVYERPFEVQFKGPDDPVTEADRRASDLICARLRSAFPGVPTVSEESDPSSWGNYRDSKHIFFVDPIDGTREFVAKNGQFVVMIGLVDEDHPSHGVLFSPTTGTLWAGVTGRGAFKQKIGEARVPLAQLQEVHINDARVAVSKSRTSLRHTQALATFDVANLVPMGSAGLKGAAVADGTCDIYLAPEFAGSLWDSCAPEAIIGALGGIFTDARGVRLDYRAARVENDRGAVASSKLLHQAVIDRLSDPVR